MTIKSLVFALGLFVISFSAVAEVVNINKANAAAFQHYLKGIGIKKSKSIVAYRAEHKKFTDIEEIMEVKGIGKGIFNKIKGNLSLNKGVVSVFKPTKKTEKIEEKSKAVKIKPVKTESGSKES